ncbi:MAG: YqhA family protein [Proteobacteria bacterium]|nr:YqhA family protein [Pseudomonadota bacterium]
MSDFQRANVRVARNLSRAVFAARWIMVPIYLGLLLSLILIAEKVLQKLVEAVPKLLEAESSDVILTVLTMVDLSLVANLVMIVMFTGWENFVGRLRSGPRSEGGMSWVSGMDFSAVKLKLIASVAAIAAIQLLETFVHIDKTPPQEAWLRLLILLGIGVTGVLLALMDKLASSDDH